MCLTLIESIIYRVYNKRIQTFFFTVKDQCHPNPCLHDGMCMEVNDELGFLCNCTAGYRGSHCQGALRDNGIHHLLIVYIYLMR